MAAYYIPAHSPGQMDATLWTDEQARVTSSRHSAESEVREADMRGQARNTEDKSRLGMSGGELSGICGSDEKAATG